MPNSNTKYEQSELEARTEKWRTALLEPSLKKFNRKPRAYTTSGIQIKHLYTPIDTKELNYMKDLGFPGEFPFTRGIQPSMYRGRLWSMRQYAGYGTAEQSNLRFKYLLSQGQPGLSVAFDLPTQIGLDSDDPRAEGEVGKVGVAIDSLADMEKLFDGISLDQVSVSMTINAPAPIIVAMYIAVAEKQGVKLENISGTVQNDILKEYIARGTYIFPPKPSLRLAADLIEFCSQKLPKFNAISVSGYHLREAGCNAAQEIGFAFSNALTYIDELISRGLDIDEFAPRISWIFNTHINFFEEIAKYRAARRLWAKIMRDTYGAKNPESWMLRMHTQTGGSVLTAQQPLNNIVRATVQALAAILGGVQSLALSCYDEALGLPSELAQKIALRTQQILAEETGICDTVDPLGGSYYIEFMTNELEKKAMAIIHEIQSLGGSIAVIETGQIQATIADQAYNDQMQLASGEKLIIGVNAYRDRENQEFTCFTVDEQYESEQKRWLNEIKRTRDHSAVSAALYNVRKAAESQTNIMPAVIEAVKTYATLGEICNTLKEVFGEYTPPIVV